MGIEWIDPPSEPGYRRPEGGDRPSADFLAYQAQQRAQTQRENMLVLGGAAVLGAGALFWIVKRRATLARGAMATLVNAELARRRAAAAVTNLADQVKAEADKRG